MFYFFLEIFFLGKFIVLFHCLLRTFVLNESILILYLNRLEFINKIMNNNCKFA